MGVQTQHPLALPLHLLTLYISLLLPPFRLRSAIFIPLIFLTLIPVYTRPFSTDPIQSYAFASTWPIALHTLTLHFTHIAPEYTHHRPGKDVPGAPASYSLRRKAGWALSLLFGLRGAGWNNTIKPQASIKKSSTSRITFITRTLARIVGYYLLLDSSRTYQIYQPYIRDGLTPSARPFHWRILDTVNIGLCAWASLDLNFNLLALILAVVGFGEPASWSPLFGGLKDIRSIRTFWARGWHQALRASFVACGSGVCWIFGLDPSQGLGKAMVVATAFVVSGIGHGIASATVVANEGGGAVLFFILQLLGVAIETVVLKVFGRKSFDTRLWWVVGYVWVLLWATVSSPPMVDELWRLGVFQRDPVPWSVVRWILKSKLELI